MSDLISRSELLKRFLVNKDGHRIPERDCDNLEVTVSIKDVKTIIKEQPTAYDIDKIVEELEKREEHYVEMLDWQGQSAICDAIEIVKQGGVSDDFCEWTQSCDMAISPHTFSKYKIKQCDGLYALSTCPYCGKKIKVVEQMDEDELRYCHHDDTDEYHDCLDYMECEECPYYYADLDQEND